ncbi:DUF5810 domain-containing protein [Natronococcus occultus]|uniref:Uncharacterized protein n=1 Tax=Natronococcus occultus SP4 TaxID=694430 RepID=L0JZS9_9EURY|nr:DUF5810 domain-containing protein [Natronococcus occultus]AGB38266.1 hypothetical protein Natoc_2494 [Natronococcus occultus SP4]
MGYRCPVCDVEEADAEHLANHLAVTASLGREDHATWLEEHAPGWADCGPEELGEIVADHATEVETPEFDDHDHERGRPSGFEDELAHQTRQRGRGSLTAEAEQVLREARELTERMADDADENENA